MKAARVTEKRRVELVEVPEPELNPGFVLVRMRLCGICGSDLHFYRGEWRAGKLGHEICGVVERVGDGVSGIAEGARVCAECFAHCGACRFCRSGDYNQCESISWRGWQTHGALTERVTYPADAVYAVPDSMSDSEAVMVEPLAVAFRAVSRGHVGRGCSVGVIGAGTIGLLCAAAAKAAGAERVVVVAKHAHQAEAASRMGADGVALLGRDDPARLLGRERPVDVAIDTAAAGTSFSTALAAVRPRGRMVLVAGVTRPIMAALGPLVDREIEITGSQCYATTNGRPDFEWAIDLIASGKVDAGGLVTHVLPLAEAAEAFRIADDKSTGSIKVAVRIPG